MPCADCIPAGSPTGRAGSGAGERDGGCSGSASARDTNNSVTGAKVLRGDELAAKREEADLYADLHEDKNYKTMEVVGTMKRPG